MQQRALDANGDYTFGRNVPFLQNSPACVAQAIMQRLRLDTGEWFLDTTEGLDLMGSIIGHNTALTRDLAVRTRILDTVGVVQIDAYLSYVDQNRNFVVLATVDTLYGTTNISTTVGS